MSSRTFTEAYTFIYSQLSVSPTLHISNISVFRISCYLKQNAWNLGTFSTTLHKFLIQYLEPIVSEFLTTFWQRTFRMQSGILNFEFRISEKIIRARLSFIRKRDSDCMSLIIQNVGKNKPIYQNCYKNVKPLKILAVFLLRRIRPDVLYV